MNPPPHLLGAQPRGSLAGRLLLKFYHTPLARLRDLRAIGLRPFLAERLGEAAMRRAAPGLPVETRPPDANSSASIVFLTGARYWHETIFCARSLLLHVDQPPPLRIISDGTLSAAVEAHFRRLFPHAEIFPTSLVEARISTRFPIERFPLLHFYRQQKPIIRKLTDVFALSDEPQLLLDSDMLFFAPPADLLGWLATPHGLLAMQDVHDAYGYSPALLQRLAGASIPSRVNIGVFGLAGRDLDWDEIERWIRLLTETEGLKYNLCQALAALLFARSPHRILHSAYRILPTPTEILKPTSIMHHYVAESKQGYRRHAWRSFVPGQPRSFA